MILLVGGTGLLGSRIAHRLARPQATVRALVRPETDSSALEALGIEVVRGDLRDRPSLVPAVAGVETIVSTANAIGRILAGERDLAIQDVDVRGYENLIEVAEGAGVSRFIYLTFGGAVRDAGVPFTEAKLATERRLRASSMQPVMVCPDMFQEVWLSPAVGFDWPAGKATVFGRGQAKAAYFAVDDVAEAVERLAEHAQPPDVVPLGGPEAITREEAVEAFARATGRDIAVRHVPRTMLRIGSVLMRTLRPATASVMGMALTADRADTGLGPEMFRELGITPRPVSAYITEVATPATQ
jgi:uncharacterized protein YbjT (DUF2867 family)